jgi:hypothetical protein
VVRVVLVVHRGNQQGPLRLLKVEMMTGLGEKNREAN